MLKVTAFLLVSASLFLQSLRSPGTATEMTDADTYDVYSTILPSEWPIRVSHAKELIILNETRTYQMCLRPDAGSDVRIEPAITNYVKLNAKPWLLSPKLAIEIPYRLISSEQLASAVGQAQWDRFYREYPDSKGWIELSAVGFNPDKTVAVVYVGHYCGVLCGGGGFHVLEKRDGKWVPLAWKGNGCSWAS